MALPQQQREYFQQEEPHLGNQYLEDSYLLALIRRKVPQDVLKKFEPDLIRFGDRVAPGGDIIALGRACEWNPPKLKTHNAFGRRIDNIEVHPAWTTLTKDVAAHEGIVAIGYERKFGEYSRLYQLLKVYLFSPSSAVADCPLSMADGGARLIELNLKHVKNEQHRKKLVEALQHLTSRDPKQIWSSGQWMTEKSGGSDVRGSETLATYDPKTDMYFLSGYKYFTSATNSEMAFTIGRTSADKNLSCFFLETRNKSGDLNNILVHKLKDKFGTRAVPTAELELRGTPAILVGPEGEGVKVISSILNITRIHNAVNSVSGARRALAIARDYSSRRKVLGRLLSDNPLHVATLAEMELEFRAMLSMLIDVLLKFGKEETLDTLGKSDEKVSTMLRILTPLLKLYAGKTAIRICSEAIECLGGTGFMEDSHLPVILRDMQVTSIWEGTTNVLSHDVWRPILKQNALPLFITETKDQMSKATTNPRLSNAVGQVNAALNSIKEFAIKASKDEVLLETSARDFALSMSRTYAAALFIEHADATGLEGDIYAANRYIARGLYSVIIESNKYEKDRIIGMDIDESTKTMRGVGDAFAGRLRARF